ncbi:MAG: hypothetical protein Q8R04_06915 [Nanoarchaeota archaeon]|nr:hypothetical protein [Nanoarchaeota archaeon]
MKTKSQITMLMIVGLVIFIVVSLVLYLSKSTIKKQGQQTIKKTQETEIDIQPIKEFVTKCLDKLAKDAVVLSGEQGGYIYSSQGGTLVDYTETDEGLFFIKYNNLNVAYNILPPKFVVPPYSSEIPDYPWQTFPYRTVTSNAEIFDGFFGINNIPPLNSSEGPNSLQVQIEAFIDNNLASCADFSIFEKQGYSIAMQPSKTSVIIGSGDVSVTSKIPITITNQATKEFAELNDFSTNLNIRLRDFYFFAKELIDNDIKNIKFDIKSANNSKDFINIKLIKNIFSNDDLVIISDEKSLIYGKPFEYIFSRRNRAPALNYIRKNTLQFPQGFIINIGNLLTNQELKAEDPDEDNYTFTITPALPKNLDTPQIKFKVEVSDGQFSDYQFIIVDRK